MDFVDFLPINGATGVASTAGVDTDGVEGVYEEMVPLSAASIEKGRADDGLFNGSMRRKGVLIRRLDDNKLTRLFCGRHPRKSIVGVDVTDAGKELEKLICEDGFSFEGAVLLTSRTNLFILIGVPSIFLERLMGDMAKFGSTFSLSKSSERRSEGSRRFCGALAGAFSDCDLKEAVGEKTVNHVSSCIRRVKAT